MKKKWISCAAALLLAALLALAASGCGPWDDAVALFSELGAEETKPSEPEPTPSPEPAPDDGDVVDALGAVVAGDCPWSPGRSVSGWLLAYYPGGDWSCTANAVDYWSTDPEDGSEAHFGFTVSPDGSFTLDVCELDGGAYTLEELAERFG